MNRTPTLQKSDIDYLCDLVEQAGLKAAAMREGVGIKEKCGPHDLVTEADYALSILLVNGIRQRFGQEVIISEEDEDHQRDNLSGNVWLIDPIDGTDNYVKNDGQYCVMVGLLHNLKPVFGWVYVPAEETVFYGGLGFGAWKRCNKKDHALTSARDISKAETVRILMGSRDRRRNPWITEVPNLEWKVSGSIGCKVMKILNDEADLFVHLSHQLKTWDTAGPVAIALGGGLEVGCLDGKEFFFPLPKIKHENTIVIGHKGALAWASSKLAPHVVNA